VSNFKRDEAYTFIHGIAIVCIWLLYLSKRNLINSAILITSPTFIMGWLASTAFLYIFYSFLSGLISYNADKKRKKKKDDDLLKERGLVKYSHLLYSGPLEEKRIVEHILGLLTTTLIIVYLPALYFFVLHSNLNAFIVHVVYTAIAVFVFYEFSKTSYQLNVIGHFISKGYCDIIDEKEYAKKRAELFAEVNNKEYINRLNKK